LAEKNENSDWLSYDLFGRISYESIRSINHQHGSTARRDARQIVLIKLPRHRSLTDGSATTYA